MTGPSFDVRTAGVLAPTGLVASAAVLLALLVGASAAAEDRDTELKRLVDKVARGDEVEAAAAREQIVKLVISPLADAVGSLDQRSVEEQLRLREMMGRLAGALRMRVFRADLPPEDRRLFDAFAAAYPELVQRLFDDHYAVRAAAVHQIPLEPNTGAGVLIAAKVNDEDGDVAASALQAAAKLRDRVVARNLTRYIHDATVTIASGFYGPEQQHLAHAIALFVVESMRVVGNAGASESTPVLVDALRFFGRSRYWDHYQRAQAMHALGELADERAAAVLLDFLDDPSPLRWQAGENKQRISQSVGDVALLSLLQIYRLSPQDFGMLPSPAEKDFAGYTDDDSRRAGHRAFRIWHQQHAGSPATRSHQPTSQPTDE